METKKCKKCQEEINKKAKKCPKCGSKQGMPTWLIVVIVIIVISIIASTGESSSSSPSKKKEGGSAKDTNEKFTLLEHQKSDESNQYFMYIEGKIKNNRDRDMSYVQVTFTTYDAEGNTLGTCLDNNSGLQANGTWKFKAICSEGVDKIDHYELKEITGY
ncbi:MAG: zinc ribbon domain-containing protein [Bacilli bacterium]|nr:zinc ribbon domain-containing protein [Bacilli bacterium]